MAPKTILVCLTTLEHAETLLKLAVPLARKHAAHLVGLHTLEALLVYPGIAMHIPGPVFASFNESQKTAAAEIREVFDRHTRNEDFPSEFRLVRAEATSASERMIESARAADIVIMSQEDRISDRSDQSHAPVQVIRRSGRPVIVVPLAYDGPTVGSNILLGWSDTREAARAAHDLVGIADTGADVTVLRVTKDTHSALEDSCGIDLAEALSRHGLKPTLERRQPSGDGIADVLNKTAFEKGADLIVTGAFGHSHAYDFVIGATSHALLNDMKHPVMFSK